MLRNKFKANGSGLLVLRSAGLATRTSCTGGQRRAYTVTIYLL